MINKSGLDAVPPFYNNNKYLIFFLLLFCFVFCVVLIKADKGIFVELLGDPGFLLKFVFI
jgi:hypothetical protein